MKGDRAKAFRHGSATAARAGAPSSPGIGDASGVLERLARQRANEQRFWRELGELHGAHLVGHAIRFPARIRGFSVTIDPICAVANLWRSAPTMNWWDAAMTVGLRMDAASEIVLAAVRDLGYDPVLRSRLLTACRLKPERER